MDAIEKNTVFPPHGLRVPFMTLDSTVVVREYQRKCVDTVLAANSGGFIVAPCAAGKTFMALLLAMENGGNFIVLTTRYSRQWYDAILKFFVQKATCSVVHLTSANLFGINTILASPTIFISTYSLFLAHRDSLLVRSLQQQRFETLILDEGHSAAASETLKLIQNMNCAECFVFTATPVREDDRLEALQTYVGNTLVTIDRKMLEKEGYVATVRCYNIRLPYKNEYGGLMKDATHRSRLLAINPPKMRALDATLRMLYAQQHKTLVFCDDLFCLEWAYAHMVNLNHTIVAKISMHTPQSERLTAIAQFSLANIPTILFISRTGDEALDVPEASAIVMFWNCWASRRQIIQRIGRISRPFGVEAISILLYSNTSRDIHTIEHRTQYLRTHNYEVVDARLRDSFLWSYYTQSGEESIVDFIEEYKATTLKDTDLKSTRSVKKATKRTPRTSSIITKLRNQQKIARTRQKLVVD